MVAPLRTRRAAFWYLGPDRIVAAVVSRTEREPVLEACAASYSAPVAGACFAPGVIEVAWVLGCDRVAHVAALAASFCRVEACEAETASKPRRQLSRVQRATGDAGPGEIIPTAQGGRERRGLVSGADGLRVWAEEDAVAQAAALFRRARLHLVALDCEPCALASLSDALGTRDTDGARRQHLSAVAVLPESESAAEALGDDLAVPVGLAVAWFGIGRAL
jgi:hypothetical protein